MIVRKGGGVVAERFLASSRTPPAVSKTNRDPQVDGCTEGEAQSAVHGEGGDPQFFFAPGAVEPTVRRTRELGNLLWTSGKNVVLPGALTLLQFINNLIRAKPL